MRRSGSAVLMAVLLLALASSAALSAVIYVKYDSPGPTFDGTSWTNAYHTVQAGLTAAVSGDEVWVASGTYVERVILKAGAALYGGFAGTETLREQRDYLANVTILDGSQGGSVVICPAGANSTTRIDGFTVRNGKASTGGGIYGSSSSLTVVNCIISGNAATADAAGMYFGGGSPMISGNTISNNACSDLSSTGVRGGGVFCAGGSPSITNNAISGNSLTSGVSALGAGICCVGGSPTISNNTMSNNTISGTAPGVTRNGGAIYCSNLSSSAVVTGNTVSGNSAMSGAGIYCSGSQAFSIANNVFSSNRSGGGVHCDNSIPVITGNVFTWNLDGIACSSGSAPTITDNTIIGNSRGIYCSGSSPQITNNLIAGNCSGSSPAGIHCTALSSPAIRNNLIIGNTATNSSGGGIGCENSSPTITNNRIVGNSAAYVGGGILVSASSTPTITNNTIIGNRATNDGGGITCNASTSVPVSNNIIAFNSSGVYNYSGASCALRNNCVYGNTSYNYSNATPGAGDISADPLLADTAYGNLHIQASSPCRNVGLNSAPGLPSTDMDGQARLQDGTVDIGADESDGTTWTVGPYAIIRVSPTGDDANDGSSWDLAKKTIQAAAVSACTRGGEVWVKAGTYNERIVLLPYVYMYGGFAGTEMAKSERNWASNKTTIDGQSAGTVVAACGYGQLNAIDGFTITRGSGTNGGAISCLNASPTIANNMILSSSASGLGGGIYCINSSSIIAGNVVAKNRATSFGAGVYCANSSATITNNTITENTSSVGNGGGGIDCRSSSPAVSNNIVAFNSTGVYSTGGSPILLSNCVYGNTGWDYSGLSAGAGDISADPLLADTPYGNYHIQAASPCRNAGSNGASGITTADMDFQSRVQEGTVDIGADESDGTTWTIGSQVVVRVSPTGNDANDGSSWALAKRTIQAGINAVSPTGEVWVKAGIYSERIVLGAYSTIYGGFAGTETARSERDWNANKTILDGGAGGSVVTMSGCQTASGIDGFTIRNGVGTNLVTGQYGSGLYGGGIYCNGSAGVIANNTIAGNNTFWGGAVFCMSSSPRLANNVITMNFGTNACGGVYCSYSRPMIANNTIRGNNRQAIICDYSSPAILNNNISGNAGGISCTNGSVPTITNNTITANSGTTGGITCSSSSPTVSNNIIAFNVLGILNSGTGTPTLRNNCLYGNTNYDYSGISAGTGDISSDPMFVDVAYGDAHIQPDSPCRNAGYDTAVLAGLPDIDGQARIQDAHVEIGADESDGTAWPVTEHLIVRVKPDGDDANNGSTWALAKRTVQAAIDATSATGGDVWVEAGIYNERITALPYVYLYGGFAGTESARLRRDWTANTTILDGGAAGAVVTFSGGHKVSLIDGFTIRNGDTVMLGRSGGGISCDSTSPTISNNIITGNRASHAGGIYCANSSPAITNNIITANRTSTSTSAHGGGISCSSASPLIANNIITANTAGRYGGGIDCSNSSSPIIVNNVISGNTGSQSGGGGICCGSSWPVIAGNTITGNTGDGVYCVFQSQPVANPVVSNNIIAFNTRGIYKINCTPALRNNCVYGNTAYDYSGLSAGVGDISVDPLLVDRIAGDYHITASSPCKNAGWNDTPGMPSIDMDGEGRICGSATDIGADEYWSTSALISDAKSLADGAQTSIKNYVVSAVFDGFLYIQDGKTIGIRVDKANHGVGAGCRVTVSGALATNTDGERFIQAAAVMPTGAGICEPFLLSNRSVGGENQFSPATGWGQSGVKEYRLELTAMAGVNNIGLLVTTTGYVTYAGSGFFYMDDGSALDDGSGHVGLKVIGTVPVPVPAPPGWDPVGQYVKVTGVSSCFTQADNMFRLLRATEITLGP